MDEAYKAINDVLVNLINEIWELEEKAIITEEFKDLTNNDMHVIEAIGLGEGRNMSSIAKKLNITVGTLTTAVNSLVNKKYAVRRRSEEDRRVVFVSLTEKGERVRSKSEKILADYFYRNKIAYKYECPLHLKGYGIVYPDFTFLSRKTKQEIYWEHDGRMDDPGYAQNAVRKILAYEENGIYPGESLILTFETEKNVLNTRIIERLVHRYLL